MPTANQQFYLKLTTVATGQAASITGRIVNVPAGTTQQTINTWTEISAGFYTQPVTLPAGEYIADITVPWDSNLHTFSILVTGGGNWVPPPISYGTVIS